MRAVTALTLLACATCLSVPVWAQSREMPSDVSLLHGWREGETHMAGVQIDLAPGWKTYWRVPGAGGIPPQIEFESSENLVHAQVGFPTPQVFWDYGMRSLGYVTQVVFPVRAVAEDPTAPITLRFHMSYGVCAEICIPAEASGEIVLSPAGQGSVEPIQAAMNAMPQSGRAHGMAAATCALNASDNGLVIEAQMPWPETMADLPHGVIEPGSDLIWVADPDVAQHEDGLQLTAQMEYFGNGTATLARERMRFTLIGSDHAIDFHGCE